MYIVYDIFLVGVAARVINFYLRWPPLVFSPLGAVLSVMDFVKFKYKFCVFTDFIKIGKLAKDIK